MSKATLGLVVAALFGLGATGLAAQGQSGNASGNASVSVPTVLIVSSVGNLTIALDNADFSGGDTGTATGSVSITTRANIVHAVEVTATAITDNDTNVELEVEDSGGTFQTAGSTAVRALAGLQRGTKTNSINFQATADVTSNDPGSYSGTITYTAVAN